MMTKHTLKSARAFAGLKAGEAAEKLGVSRATLRSWENGTTFPTAVQFSCLCKLYGVSMDEIFLR